MLRPLKLRTYVFKFHKTSGNYAWPCIGVFFKFE
jgi:hypothetical protein